MPAPRPRTMHEFADAAGLSRPTVSKYFNDPRSVRSTTRARIERAMADLDYRPNFFALNQNRRTSKTIGILVPQLGDPFYSEIVRRLEVRAIEAGYWPLLLSSHGSAELEARGVDTMRSLRVAGALVAPLGDATDAGQLHRLAADVPVVLFDTPLGDGFAFVGTDNARSVGRMVAHLCEGGEPPCYLGFPDLNAISRERRDGYLRAMEAEGHEPRLLPVAPGGWDFERQGFEAAARALGAGGFPAGAVLCASDRLAFGVLAACHAAGVAVGPGRGLRVAGHDDHPLAEFACPALTTVAQDYGRLSEVATEMLLALVDGGDTGLRSYRMASTLIRRRSA